MKTLWIDAVGLYHVRDKLGRYDYGRLVKYLWGATIEAKLGLFVDGDGLSEKCSKRATKSQYIRASIELLRETGFNVDCYWYVPRGGGDCSYVCIKYHEAYKALCSCSREDEFITAVCNCRGFKEGVDPNAGGVQVFDCFVHLACPSSVK